MLEAVVTAFAFWQLFARCWIMFPVFEGEGVKA